MKFCKKCRKRIVEKLNNFVLKNACLCNSIYALRVSNGMFENNGRLKTVPHRKIKSH